MRMIPIPCAWQLAETGAAPATETLLVSERQVAHPMRMATRGSLELPLLLKPALLGLRAARPSFPFTWGQ